MSNKVTSSHLCFNHLFALHLTVHSNGGGLSAQNDHGLRGPGQSSRLPEVSVDRKGGARGRKLTAGLTASLLTRGSNAKALSRKVTRGK